MWGWRVPQLVTISILAQDPPPASSNPSGYTNHGDLSPKALTHLGKGRPATCDLCAAGKLAERIHLMVATLSDGHGSSPPQTQGKQTFL